MTIDAKVFPVMTEEKTDTENIMKIINIIDSQQLKVSDVLYEKAMGNTGTRILYTEL